MHPFRLMKYSHYVRSSNTCQSNLCCPNHISISFYKTDKLTTEFNDDSLISIYIIILNKFDLSKDLIFYMKLKIV